MNRAFSTKKEKKKKQKGLLESPVQQLSPFKYSMLHSQLYNSTMCCYAELTHRTYPRPAIAHKESNSCHANYGLSTHSQPSILAAKDTLFFSSHTYQHSMEQDFPLSFTRYPTVHTSPFPEDVFQCPKEINISTDGTQDSISFPVKGHSRNKCVMLSSSWKQGTYWLVIILPLFWKLTFLKLYSDGIPNGKGHLGWQWWIPHIFERVIFSLSIALLWGLYSAPILPRTYITCHPIFSHHQFL